MGLSPLLVESMSPSSIRVETPGGCLRIDCVGNNMHTGIGSRNPFKRLLRFPVAVVLYFFPPFREFVHIL